MLLIDIGGAKLQRVAHKWKTVDIRDNADFKVDLGIVKKIPIEDEKVDAIYTSHTLEHIEMDRIDWCFEEMRRILKPNTSIRIVVPDIEIAIKKYVEKDYEWLSKKENPSKYKVLPDISICYLHCWFNTPGYGHKMTFNDELLTYYLKKHHFNNIVKKAYNDCSKIFEGKDIVRYKECSLYYEATK